jgi:hypothetical protein
MRQVIASYPNWLHVVTNTANLALWHEDGVAASRRSRSEAARKLLKALGVAVKWLLVLAVLGVLAWAWLSEGDTPPHGNGLPAQATVEPAPAARADDPK